MLIPSGVSPSSPNVSTVPENKNVILEEFTGIQCVYCPDGHLIADQIQSNNINDVYIIKIHTGGYSYPSAGQPDFRTQWGYIIENQSDIIGYPCANINRHYFPTLTSQGGTSIFRNNWALHLILSCLKFHL